MEDYIFMMGIFLGSVVINVAVAGYLTVLMGEFVIKQLCELEIKSLKSIAYLHGIDTELRDLKR
ncbi:hypothetical protein [uncultured Veillonella sp.]|uniref:hypothetical protein n=1 Tax=uncultured Veillonella sp. TaxID=159268 RepID=UPI002595CCD7|nr:hypothetical protein [uncultured Veillonella sp.]